MNQLKIFPNEEQKVIVDFPIVVESKQSLIETIMSKDYSDASTDYPEYEEPEDINNK
jgi:hypothetical protein